jgi:hypothetical protein
VLLHFTVYEIDSARLWLYLRRPKTLCCTGIEEQEETDNHLLRMEQTGKQFHGFMRLPLRIRYIIYEHALVRGEIFVDPSSDQQGNEVENWPYEDWTGAKRQRYQNIEQYRRLFDPRRKYIRKRVAINPISAGLLIGVSKTAQAVAKHVFWAAGNQFIFPPGKFEAPRDLCVGSQLTPLPRLKPVRNVSYSFDMQDVEFPSPLFIEMKLKSKYEADGHRSFSKLSRDKKREMDHNESFRVGIASGGRDAR